ILPPPNVTGALHLGHGLNVAIQFGILISFAYPLEGDLGEIVVATTRVETMLGDTAIAVHSNDKRYTHLHGKRAVHPFNGRKLSVICDDNFVDLEYGTGAIKVRILYIWLENICDWCISRQLWWGHRVPAWYVTLEDDQFKDLGSYNDHWVVRRSEQEVVLEAKQMFAGKKFEIAQDPDVLDT
ncbi:hypothetical protein BHM03_00054407, partial [Ensete ventricosum]